MQRKPINCQAWNTKRMVSCNQCNTWWQYECAGVNDSIADDDRTFTCPTCQKPSSWMPYEATPNPSERGSLPGSKVESTSAKSSASSRTRRARLELERLIALREREQKRLDIEMEVLEATFRARKAELDNEEINRSVSPQISFGKVTEWQKRHQQNDDVNSTMIPISEAQTSTSRDTTGTVTQPGQGGVTHQPGSESGPLAGTPLYGSGQMLGVIIDRTSHVTAPSGPRILPLIPTHLSPIDNNQALPVLTEGDQITPSSHPLPEGFLGKTGNNGEFGETQGANVSRPPSPELWSCPPTSGPSTSGPTTSGAPALGSVPSEALATGPPASGLLVPPLTELWSSASGTSTTGALGAVPPSQHPHVSGPPLQLPPVTWPPASRPLVPGRPAPGPPSQQPPTSGPSASGGPVSEPPSQLSPAPWPPKSGSSVPGALGPGRLHSSRRHWGRLHSCRLQHGRPHRGRQHQGHLQRSRRPCCRRQRGRPRCGHQHQEGLQLGYHHSRHLLRGRQHRGHQHQGRWRRRPHRGRLQRIHLPFLSLTASQAWLDVEDVQWKLVKRIIKPDPFTGGGMLRRAACACMGGIDRGKLGDSTAAPLLETLSF